MLNVSKTNTANVVDTTYLKTWLRISGTAEDSQLTDLIKAAQDYIEKATGLLLTASTVIAKWQPFSGNESLPYAPFTAVTSVTSDAVDVATGYTVATDTITGTATDLDLTLTYTGGYTDNLPYGLKQILLRLITHWYMNRGDTGNVPKDIIQDMQIYTRNLPL